MRDSDDNLITLVDEDGQEHEFVVECTLEVDGETYAVLIPQDDGDLDDDEAEAFIFRVEGSDGEEQLVTVDDEEEFERVAEAFAELEDWDEEGEDGLLELED